MAMPMSCTRLLIVAPRCTQRSQPVCCFLCNNPPTYPCMILRAWPKGTLSLLLPWLYGYAQRGLPSCRKQAHPPPLHSLAHACTHAAPDNFNNIVNGGKAALVEFYGACLPPSPACVLALCFIL